MQVLLNLAVLTELVQIMHRCGELWSRWTS